MVVEASMKEVVRNQKSWSCSGFRDSMNVTMVSAADWVEDVGLVSRWVRRDLVAAEDLFERSSFIRLTSRMREK